MCLCVRRDATETAYQSNIREETRNGESEGLIQTRTDCRRKGSISLCGRFRSKGAWLPDVHGAREGTAQEKSFKLASVQCSEVFCTMKGDV